MSLFEDDYEENDYDAPSFTASSSSDNTLQEPPVSNFLIGHDDVEQDILASWNAGRMPHALVLNGLKGIGKATFAYRLARFVLKEGSKDAGGLFGDDVTPTTMNVSADDAVYQKIASGGHPDFMIVGRPFDEKKGMLKDDIPVDEIRKVTPFLRKTSSDGGWRVVVIDDANLMNRNGQNALLKILEEPPKNALLILVTHGAGGLLPTIRSRCRFLPFKTLSDDNVNLILDKASNTPLLPSDKDILVSLADGSAGQAVELYQQGGVEAATILLNALVDINAMTGDQLDALALSYGKSGDKQIIQKFNYILNWWFESLIYLATQNLKTKQIGGIDIVIPPSYTLKSMLELHQEVDNHIQTCLNGNLDKRYMIYKTLRMIQS